MKELNKKKIFSWSRINLPLTVLIGLLIACALLLWGFLEVKSGTSKLAVILSGLLTGFIIVIIQFLFSWAEYSTLNKIRSLGVKNILSTREDREFYENLIRESTERIYVMGVTASRFMDHFANVSGTERSKVLLIALTNEVDVKILVPNPKKLSIDKNEKTKKAREAFERVSKNYENFEFRYFDHEPAHSIVVVDHECILGPVFPDRKSEFTPAIYIEANSDYSKNYIEYFDNEWISAKNA